MYFQDPSQGIGPIKEFETREPYIIKTNKSKKLVEKRKLVGLEESEELVVMEQEYDYKIRKTSRTKGTI